jgi:hypothetical protein
MGDPDGWFSVGGRSELIERQQTIDDLIDRTNQIASSTRSPI